VSPTVMFPLKPGADGLRLSLKVQALGPPPMLVRKSWLGASCGEFSSVHSGEVILCGAVSLLKKWT